ncbi:hypothetical protein EVA_19905 [gut metagenome]|uniref:Uncharacterized protein n=1 Tax=gut metagenome TaxID=749906 RepID=J9FQY3_9ZZZZ
MTWWTRPVPSLRQSWIPCPRSWMSREERSCSWKLRNPPLKRKQII